MDYKIQIRPLATVEILETYDWYEQQRQGLGDKFLEELDDFYAILLNNPNTFSYYQKPVRQGLLKKFPYQVVYEVFNNDIVVYSVFMAKQTPIRKGRFKPNCFLHFPQTLQYPLLFLQ